MSVWGGRVVMAQEELTPKQPVAPLDYTGFFSCPLLGLFGEEDRSPTPARRTTEGAVQAARKAV